MRGGVVSKMQNLGRHHAKANFCGNCGRRSKLSRQWLTLHRQTNKGCDVSLPHSARERRALVVTDLFVTQRCEHLTNNRNTNMNR
jgi:hypothetical protein